MAVPPGAPDSIMITSPSTSSMISDRHLDVSHRSGRLHGVPSPVKELNLNASLPPTPEFARFPHPSNSYPHSPPEYPSRSPTSAFFPGTARRKTSSASQHPPHPRTSVASTASSGSTGGYSMPPPALPIRSPLRKHSNKSLASFTGVLRDFNLAETSPVPLPPPSPTTSIPPYNTAGSSNGPNLNGRETPSSRTPPSRALPPGPPINSFSPSTDPYGNANPSVISLSTQDYSSNTATPAASGSSPSLSGTFSSTVVNETGAEPGAKRRHALLELLTTERSYAADLAVVKEIHIPLSRGLACRFQQPPPPLPKDPPATPNGVHMNGNSKSQPPSLSSRRSSAHTTSTVSSTNISTAPSSSTSLTPSQTQTQNKPSDSELPMTFEASKIIFGNIEELAQFADVFAERLELALGDVLDGGQGKDSVGALFLEVIPQIADKFKTYITRHPTALAQFQSLPQCAALTAYLAEAKSLADSHTHAWDIPSLLIKPVQRLLKYPLLIAQIIGCTPDDHPDKTNLVEAKDKIEEVARAVNEGRRRWEVVKAVLAQNADGKAPAKEGAASTSNGMTPARPKVGRMRSFRSKIKPGVADSDAGKAKDEMEEWEKRLKDCEMACKELAKGSLQWCRDVQFAFKKLKAWNASFGNVVGLGEHGVEAVGAFGKVVSGLQTLWTDLDNTLQSVLLPQLQKLVKSLSSPQILLAHMHTLYHSHITLLNTPYNKSRPPNALHEASQDFLALRATLREELPSFFFMFEKGLGLVLVEFSRWQGRLYREVKERWMQFWIALAVDDGEANPEGVISGIGSGSEETVAIWRERFEEVQEVLNSFRTMKKPLPAPQMRSKSQPHLPQPQLQLQLPPQGTLPPTAFPRTASSAEIYRHKNGSTSSVGERSGNHQVYQRPTHSQSAHALQTPIDDRERRFWEFNGDFGPFPDLRAKSPGPPPSTRGAALHMRNGSGEIDALRAKDMPLASMMPPPPKNAPTPSKSASTPSKRDKSRDRDKNRDKERDADKERLEKEKKLERERLEKEKKEKQKERERVREQEREEQERIRREEQEKARREEQERARARERDLQKQREIQAQLIRERQKEVERQREIQKKLEIEREQERRREAERLIKEREKEKAAREAVKAPKLSLKDLRPRERMKSEGSLSLPPAHEYHGETSSIRGMKTMMSPPSPVTSRPLSPISPSRMYRRSKEKSRDLDDDTASIRSTSSRAFRQRITNPFTNNRPPHARSNSTPPVGPILAPPLKPQAMTSNKSDIPADPASSSSGSRYPNIHRRGPSVEDVFTPLPPLPLAHPVEPPLSASFPDHLDPPPSPLYSCTTIVPFLPPPGTPNYMNLPMLRLHVGDTIEVLHEAGHPSQHALPFQVDEGDDCILLARDEGGHVGWAFASFVIVTT